MVAGIRGYIDNILPNEVYVNTNSGIIYLVNISLNTFNEIKNLKSDEILNLKTEYVVSENSVKLYGFFTNEELTLFKLLTKVPKVGHSTALSICGEISIKDLYEIITTKDISKMKKIKGLGEKTCLNIVSYLQNSKLIIPIQQIEIESYKELDTIKSALQNLGFVEKQYKHLLKEINVKDNVEDNIKYIIKKIK